MVYISITLVMAGLLVVVLRCSGKAGGEEKAGECTGSCASCGEQPSRCVHACMLEAAVKDVEYYDDEELDAFAGRQSDMYDDEEAGQFRYVLYTMRREEVAGWCRSISLRGINLPDQIKDEVAMLLA